MTFKLADKLVVKWPVTVHVPQDGGSVVSSTFHVRFEVVSQDELQANTLQGKDLLDRVVVGWEGYAAEDNSDIVYGPETKAKLLQATSQEYAKKDVFPPNPPSPAEIART